MKENAKSIRIFFIIIGIISMWSVYISFLGGFASIGAVIRTMYDVFVSVVFLYFGWNLPLYTNPSKIKVPMIFILITLLISIALGANYFLHGAPVKAGLIFWLVIDIILNGYLLMQLKKISKQPVHPLI